MVFALVLGFALVLVAEMIGRLLTNAPFVPTPGAVVDKIAEYAKLSDGEVFYDLGCGEGQVVRAVAARYPGARAVGVELAPFPYYLARLGTSHARLPNATYVRNNLFDVPLTDASCVFLYLLPQAMERLSPKLRRELKAGSRVITYDFRLEDWHPTHTEEVRVGTGRRPHTLYFYTNEKG